MRRGGARFDCRAGLDLKAVISGDDLLDARDNFADKKDMFSGADCPPGNAGQRQCVFWAGFPLRQRWMQGLILSLPVAALTAR